MKKMMTAAAAALCAAVVFGEGVTSANIVGYNGKEAGENLNWYAPQFMTVGATTSDINAIQLDDDGAGMVGWGDSMQIVGPLGPAIANYFFYDPSMDPDEQATAFYWGDEVGYPVDVTLQPGDGFAVDNSASLTFDIVIKCPYTL